MSLKKIRSYCSSFWLSFLGIIIINQILLFVIFHFVTIRPTAKDMTQLFGASIEMIRHVNAIDPENGLDKLILNLKRYPAITIEKKKYKLDEIPWQFFGLKMIKKSIRSDYSQEVDVGYVMNEKGANELIIQSINDPIISLKISFGATLIVQQYVQYSLLLVFAISIWAAYWISSRIVRPLESLSMSASQLSSCNDANKIDMSSFSVPEIKKLAGTLNHMHEKINSNIRERESILSSVTHDIRTPLSRMRIALELNSDGDYEFKNELLEDINEMNIIIQQFNELAKLNIEIDESFELMNINKLIIGIKSKYKRAKIDLSTNLGVVMELNLKPLSITRLLYNLIDNAYRYGNSEVEIATYQNNNEVVVSVINPIFPQSDINDGYYDPIFNHKTGLGLMIVKRLADVHNAKIEYSMIEGVRVSRLILKC